MNCSDCNPFRLITLQIARGVPPPALPTPLDSTRKALSGFLPMRVDYFAASLAAIAQMHLTGVIK
jgi:hypothetical protein